MAVRKKDAVLITKEVFDEIPLTFKIKKVIDLLTTPPLYQLNTRDTLHLRPDRPIVIDGKNYKIEAFVINVNIIISGKTLADTIPTVNEFTVYEPHFVHGTPIITQQEQNEKKKAKDRTPMVWLREVLEEDRNTNLDDIFGLRFSARIYFMDESQLKDFTPLHYINVIRPMMQLAETFVSIIQENNNKFNEEFDYKIIPHANFGKEDLNQGHVSNFFGENLSGVELKIDLEVERDACVLDICGITVDVSHTNVTTSGGSDGTATANVTGERGTVTFLWNDPLSQTTQTAVGLAEGPYMVTVTDDILEPPSCEAIGFVTIIEHIGFTFKSKKSSSLIVSIIYGGSGTIDWSDNLGNNLVGPSVTFITGWVNNDVKTVFVSVDEQDKITAFSNSQWNNIDLTALIMGNLVGLGSDFRVTDNPELINLVFGLTTAAFTRLRLFNNGFTTLDLSKPTQIGTRVEIRNNPQMTTFIKGTSPLVLTEWNQTNIGATSTDLSGYDITGTFASSGSSSLQSIIHGANTLNITDYQAQNNDLLAHDVSMLKISGSYRADMNSNMKTHIFPSNTNVFSLVRLGENDLDFVDFSVMPNMMNTNNGSYRIETNGQTAAEVNHELFDLAAMVSGESGGGDFIGRVIFINGTNAAPDSSSGGFDGDQAVLDLVGKGIVVNTN